MLGLMGYYLLPLHINKQVWVCPHVYLWDTLWSVGGRCTNIFYFPHSRSVLCQTRSPRGDLAMSEQIFGYHNSRKAVVLASSNCRLGMLLNILQRAGQPAATENHQAEATRSAEAEMPCSAFSDEGNGTLLPGSWHYREGLIPSISLLHPG